MQVKEIETEDIMRGSNKKVCLRFNPEDLELLSCDSNYDPKLDKQVRLLRKAEVKKGELWEPYPTVVFHSHEERLQTMVMVGLSDDRPGVISIMGSANGVPDGKLELAAEAVGIFISTVD